MYRQHESESEFLFKKRNETVRESWWDGGNVWEELKREREWRGPKFQNSLHAMCEILKEFYRKGDLGQLKMWLGWVSEAGTL